MTAVMATSLINAFVAANRAQREIDEQVDQIVRTLRDPRFPLVNSTLDQVSRLSGAEYAVTDNSHNLSAASFETNDAIPVVSANSKRSLGRAPTWTHNGKAYYHIANDLPAENSPSYQARTLHIFYPQEQYQTAWRDAMVFPLVTGSLAVLVVFALSYSLAARITQPIEIFRRGVNVLTEGKFAPLAIPKRNDEIRDLVVAINLLAERLEKYETEIRSRERLRTLGQLGAGMAHQLRNAVTGCRLALDLHSRDCQSQNESTLQVAHQQLSLMEEYLKRFLAYGKQPAFSPKEFDLREVIDASVRLIEPLAKHARVELAIDAPTMAVKLQGDSHLLCQALINLLMNAIEAVSRVPFQQPSGEEGEWRSDGKPRVWIQHDQDGETVKLEVIDNGQGPTAQMKDVLFEPLQTDKPEGTGLGLSVAHDIVNQHHGSLAWCRSNDRTYFTIELPRGSTT